MIRELFIIYLAAASVNAFAQTDNRMQYRNMVLDYNQDVKSAEHSEAISAEMKKAAKADFFPKLYGNANFNYTGNAPELTIKSPIEGNEITFQGEGIKYGASLTLAQPVYSGGLIKAGYDKANKQLEMSRNESERITNNILFDADVHYWNTVAGQEMVVVAEEFRNSVAQLVDVVRNRVEVEYVDRNDLLMAEVRLNNADYQLLQARNNSETSRLALNSFAGVPFDSHIAVDSTITALKEAMPVDIASDSVAMSRPELRIAGNMIDIKHSEAKIANSKYLPQVSVGLDGSYSSPGYDFKSGADPNYAVYVKLSVPVFEWGKRRSTRRAGKLGVDIATENYSSVKDNVQLEIETAFYTYNQAVEQVILTENSLDKARENEELAMDQYKEGRISIVEVLNAQMYHQEAKVNHIQSKLNAQIAKSAYDRAVGIINN